MRQKVNLRKILPLVLLAALLYLLCSRFSYYADDWFWGTDSRFSTFVDSFSNPENPFHFYNNGRYFGNGLGFLFANHRLLRDLFMTAVLWTIIVFLSKISLKTARTEDIRGRELMLCICGTVLLLCPKEMFRESIGWSVAFTNYVCPSALYLLCLRLLFNQKPGGKLNLLFFLLPLTACFFIENLTIGNAIFIVLWILWKLLRKRTLSGNEWIYLAGSILGLVLMLSDDGYRSIMQGNAEETYWGANTGSLLQMLQTGINAFRNFIAKAIVGWMTLQTSFGALSYLAAFLLMQKNCNKKNRMLLLILTLTDCLTAAFFLLRRLTPEWEPFLSLTADFEAILALLFILSQPVIILLLPLSEKQKETLVFSWLFSALVTVPLAVAEPLSMRVFFPTMVFLLLLYSQITCIDLEILRSCISHRAAGALLPYAAGLFLLGWGYLFSIYAVIDHYEKERIKYVRYQESIGNYDIDFPTLPYAEHVIVSYPWENTWQDRYKKFFDLNPGMRFNIVAFDEWKEKL